MARAMGKWKAKLMLLSASMLFVFGVAEVGLRVIGFHSTIFQQMDPVTGRSLRPGAKGWFTSEGRALVEINSDGMRDREYPLKKPAGTVRIAVLGDSYAEAMQVSLEDSFPKLLEKSLNADDQAGSPRVEVLNFGVSAYGTGSELLTLQNKVWKYQPDIVVLAIFTGNDICDNSQELSRGFDSGRPYFRVDENGKIAIDESFRDSAGWRNRRRLEQSGLVEWVNRSALLQLIRRVRLKPAVGPRAAPDRPWEEVGVDAEAFAEPGSDAWREAWQTMEGLIGAIRDDVENHDARLVVVTLSAGIQVHPDAKLREQFRAALQIEDEFYPDRRIEEFCRAQGISAITLAPKLQQIAVKEGSYFHGFRNTRLGTGHWNQAGHKAAASLIAPAIRKMVATGDVMELATRPE